MKGNNVKSKLSSCASGELICNLFSILFPFRILSTVNNWEKN